MAPVALLTYDEGWYGWGRYLYPAAPMLGLATGAALVDGALPRLRPRVRQFAAAALALAVLFGVAQTFAAGRDWHDDRALAEAMIADHPESSNGYSELAVIELRAHRPAEALALLERASAIAPDNHTHWSRAATALMQLERRPEAYAAAARALALDPTDTNARYVTAIRLLGERREAEAAELLLAAIAAEPEQAGPRQTLREALSHLGPQSRFAEAVRAHAAKDPRLAALVSY
jgi:thioredoxin-like negative regulator of GroEL